MNIVALQAVPSTIDLNWHHVVTVYQIKAGFAIEN